MVEHAGGNGALFWGQDANWLLSEPQGGSNRQPTAFCTSAATRWHSKLPPTEETRTLTHELAHEGARTQTHTDARMRTHIHTSIHRRIPFLDRDILSHRWALIISSLCFQQQHCRRQAGCDAGMQQLEHTLRQGRQLTAKLVMRHRSGWRLELLTPLSIMVIKLLERAQNVIPGYQQFDPGVSVWHSLCNSMGFGKRVSSLHRSYSWNKANYTTGAMQGICGLGFFV